MPDAELYTVRLTAAELTALRGAADRDMRRLDCADATAQTAMQSDALANAMCLLDCAELAPAMAAL